MEGTVLMAYPIYDDDLRALAAALPPEFKASRDDMKGLQRRFALQRPDYYIQPISNAECAALLGKTPGALRVMRNRGNGPPGFTEIEGLGWVYPSRLHVLEWIADQIEQAALEPSRRREAA